VGALTTVPDPTAPENRQMTRCECAEMAFSAIARLVREQGLSLDEVTHRTGCGRTCTACLPDLQHYLKSR
jgi:NAD(P)H-nitrite reductase large subunit